MKQLVEKLRDNLIHRIDKLNTEVLKLTEEEKKIFNKRKKLSNLLDKVKEYLFNKEIRHYKGILENKRHTIYLKDLKSLYDKTNSTLNSLAAFIYYTLSLDIIPIEK